MNKRIIDGMSSQEIVDGIFSINDGYKIVKIGDYIHQICKPVPTWEDDVSDDNPVLCWVSNEPIPESGGEPFNRGTDHVFVITKEGYYMGSRGHRWKYARPISPDEIWQPTKQGNTK